MKALIIGIGQDAKLLSIGLKNKNIDFKILIKPSTLLAPFVPNCIEKNHLLFGDARDLSCLLEYMSKYKFTHIYNVAGNTFSQASKMNFFQYLNSNTQILTNILSLQANFKKTWIYHPLSSEILSDNREKNNIFPRNAYGISKATEYHISRLAEIHGVNIFYPILFNHESCFRSKKFFSAKLIHFLKKDDKGILEIWNTNSSRDWGSAKQFMDLILNSSINQMTGSGQLGTSNINTVAEFVSWTLEEMKIKYKLKKTKKKRQLWQLSDGRKIIEKEQDNNDAKRIVIANNKKVYKTFGTNKLIHGKQLIRKLIEEYDKYDSLI